MVLIEGGFLFVAEAFAICLGVKLALSGSGGDLVLVPFHQANAVHKYRYFD